VSTLVFVLFMAGMFGIGVWLGWYAAHLDIRFESDLAEYLSTGSLPALSFDSAGQGAARTEPPSAGAGRASPEM